MPAPRRTWFLTAANGDRVASDSPGKFGGHRGTHIYGRLDCPAALRAIARGGYVGNRVFFRDAATARAAGYRPCAVCLPKEYARWKARAPTRRAKPRRAG
ncbi:MAG TPA: Ada metal-binding domain-containing protein [Steroidobacteraceae bacterium]|jgi:methylphosphotriester-DNA--protein-cysteine methyltransferase